MKSEQTIENITVKETVNIVFNLIIPPYIIFTILNDLMDQKDNSMVLSYLSHLRKSILKGNSNSDSK